MRIGATIGASLAILVASLPAAAAAPVPNAMAGFVKSCQTQMYMSQAACACMAQRAATELDAREIAYLSVPGNNGPAAAAATRAMNSGEIARVDKFMRSAPPACEGAK